MSNTAHVDYPHEPGTLYDCAACDKHAREAIAKRAWIDVDDVYGSFGDYTIDGMDAEEWIDAVLGDDDE